ncbi:hypothetical protein [Paenibacillus aestuarii]|uniref:GAF domain-containing protein n=1 Tax=Paenibacillus aestuarii TaxID=516965 RepID=A0ABW0K9B4_9BACL|nr:hypothetical protein [Paenibacillus aestuarii]
MDDALEKGQHSKAVTSANHEDIKTIYESYDAIKLQNKMIQAQISVLHHIALGEPLSQIVYEIMQQYDLLFDDQVFGSIYLIRENGEWETCRPRELPFSSFKHQFLDHEVLSLYPFEKETNFIEPALMTEIPSKRTFTKEFNDVLKACGIRSCWLFPLLAPSRKLLGLHMFYAKAPLVPSLELQKTVEAIVKLNVLAIEIENSHNHRNSV